MLERYRRELSVAIAILALSIALAILAPGFFSPQNLSDLLLANMPALIVALGMTLVTLAGVADRPRDVQWCGVSQPASQAVTRAIAIALTAAAAWSLRNLAAGRAVYATGSNADAARLLGIDTRRVTFSVFAITGGLAGCAA